MALVCNKPNVMASSTTDGLLKVVADGATATPRITIPVSAIKMKGSDTSTTVFIVQLVYGMINRPNTEYSVTIEANSFVDVAQNSFIGISNAWTFHTGPVTTADLTNADRNVSFLPTFIDWSQLVAN